MKCNSEMKLLCHDLKKGLTELREPLSSSAIDNLLHYLMLLAKWNAVYNLTGIKNIAQMIPTHILDSLSCAPYIVGPRMIDVGTGAGLPGIPLAIRFPEYSFYLLDSKRKKMIFLRHAISELKLSNVTLIQQHSLDYKPKEKFNTVVSRATTSLSRLIKETEHLIAPQGILLAMKGKYPHEECKELPPLWQVQVIPCSIPFLNKPRHLVRCFISQQSPAGKDKLLRREWYSY